MDEYERRIEAIRRVAQGESVAQVCAALGRTRVWYYKWQARYHQQGVTGLEDQRPGHPPARRTPDRIQELVIETRDRLVE